MGNCAGYSMIHIILQEGKMDYIILGHKDLFLVEITGTEHLFDTLICLFDCIEKKEIPVYGLDNDNNDYLYKVKIACCYEENSNRIKNIIVLRPARFTLTDMTRWIQEIRGIPGLDMISEKAWEQIFTTTDGDQLIE